MPLERDTKTLARAAHKRQGVGEIPVQHEASEYLVNVPELYQEQSEAIYAPERYSIIEASTKSGKTLGCMRWLLEQAIQGAEGDVFYWVAPSYAQTKIAFRRYRRLLPMALRKVNEGEPSITLANGAIIYFKTAENPDLLYGDDVVAAVVDEATRVREEAWHAVRSTLTHTEGPVRLIGNVHGRKNWAYMMARRAEQGRPGYHYARLVASDAVEAGILSAAEIDDARSILPDYVFRELYLAEPSEDGSNPFGMQALRDCTAPMTRGSAIVFGIDLARGRNPGDDYTVVIGLDAQRRVCVFERFQGFWDTQIPRIQAIVGTTPALVDSTGVGDPVLEALQKAKGSRYTGFKFSATSKQTLMEGLVLAIQQGTVFFPEGVITRELEEFGFEVTRTGVRYSAPVGIHDDCVCALALAVAHFYEGKPVLQRFDKIVVFSAHEGPVAHSTDNALDREQRRIVRLNPHLHGDGWPGLGVRST